MTATARALAAPILLLLLLLAPGPARALDIPPFEVFEHPSGLRVVVVPDHSLPYLTVSFAVPVGSLQDPPGKEGLANMAASLLRYGTGALDDAAVAEAIDGLGAGFSAAADTDSIEATGDVATLDPKATRAFLDLFLDLVTRPTLDQASLDRYRKILLGRLMSSVDDNAGLASLALRRWALPGHPMGRPLLGTLESIEALSEADVRRFWKRHVVPQHAYLYVGGDIDRATLTRILDAHDGLRAWAEGSRGICRRAAGRDRRCAELCLGSDCRPNLRMNLPAASRAPAPSVLLIDKKEAGLNQEQFRIAFVLDRPVGSKGWFPLRLATQMLGGDYTARLNRVLRIERGLTYGARLTAAYGTPFAGLAYVSTFTKPKDVIRALDLAFEQLRGFGQEKPTGEETASSKDKIINRRAFNFETVNGVIDHLMYVDLNGLDLDFIRRYEDHIRAVTPEQARDAAKANYGPRHSRIVVVGNASDAKALGAWVKRLGGTLTVRPAAAVLHAAPLQK